MAYTQIHRYEAQCAMMVHLSRRIIMYIYTNTKHKKCSTCSAHAPPFRGFGRRRSLVMGRIAQVRLGYNNIAWFLYPRHTSRILYIYTHQHRALQCKALNRVSTRGTAAQHQPHAQVISGAPHELLMAKESAWWPKHIPVNYFIN